MDIKWHGLSCFTIKGKSATVVLDPYDAKAVGLKLPVLDADIVLANSDCGLHKTDDFAAETKIFTWPGEYESKNVIIQGISAYDKPREKEETKKDDANKVNIFTILIDEFKICHLSNVGHKLTPEMLEMIGDSDILMIPIGGAGCLDAKKAHEVIEQIDPRVVIPMYYKVDGLKLPLNGLADFIKEMGIQSQQQEKVAKFSVPSALPQENTSFVILEPSLG